MGRSRNDSAIHAALRVVSKPYAAAVYAVE
jgi:hypothetical protein